MRPRARLHSPDSHLTRSERSGMVAGTEAMSRWMLLATPLFGLSMCGTDEAASSSRMPPSAGSVMAFDREALLAGNRGLGCPAPEVEARVDAWLGALSLEQKVHEMHGAALTSENGFYLAG